MLSFIGKRLIMLLPTLLVPLFLVFFLLRLAPGDPASFMLGIDATPEQVDQLRDKMGLNEPLHIQLIIWLKQLVTMDLGDSIFLKQPVLQVILEHMPTTILLTIFSLIVAIIIGVGSGIISAVFRNKPVDHIAMTGAMVGVSMPEFWFGLMLILVFSVKLQWFPVAGFVPLSEGVFACLRSLTLPAMSLGLIQAAFIARITRSSMLDVIHEDFVRTARAKGLSPRLIVFKHVLRNALIPIITVIGITTAVLMGGAIAIETVFTLPGIGRMLISAVSRRDYPLIQGIVLFVSLMFIVINLVVDIIYTWVDPRIKYQ
ncbi:ABC transporter permease [Paenibacillus agricola]|uniref:ABC transporter permease n=1 Tax=Paenibacillus agricola TaxID=2716264 RepID=A0ABX0J8V7_9BACL|nr:ABC transporter permease [Paenibacillus agricola]NHN31756.1 ABC transporter permease [Paenibacillus agricola]